MGAVEGGVVQADAQVAQGSLSPPQRYVVMLAPLVVLLVLLEKKWGGGGKEGNIFEVMDFHICMLMKTQKRRNIPLATATDGGAKSLAVRARTSERR